MVGKPFSPMYLNVDDHSSANATEDRDNTMKKQKKSPLFDTMSSENKNVGRLSPYHINTHIPQFREILKHHIYKNEMMRNVKSPSEYKGQQSPSNSFVDYPG